MSSNRGVEKSPAVKQRHLRQRIQIGLGVLLAANAIFLFLMFRPSGYSPEQEREELKRLRGEVMEHRATVARYQRIQDSLTQANHQGEAFYGQQFLPATTGFSTTMQEIDKMAGSSGVRRGAVSYAVSEIKDRTDLEAVVMSTSIEADYSKIVRFVNQLEQSKMFLIVDTLSLATGQGRMIRLDVTFRTVFRI